MLVSMAAERKSAIEARERALLERDTAVQSRNAAELQRGKDRCNRAAEMMTAEAIAMGQGLQTKAETGQIRAQMAAAAEAAQCT